MNQIEKLKDKTYVRAFGLMSEAERKTYREVGAKNCKVYHNEPCGWLNPNIFDESKTYAIKPDYQPEPEFVDYEITANADTWLGSQTLSGNWMRLYKLPSLPNFEGFFMPDPVVKDGHEYLFIGIVARNIAKGKKVYARFRRDT